MDEAVSESAPHAPLQPRHLLRRLQPPPSPPRHRQHHRQPRNKFARRLSPRPPTPARAASAPKRGVAVRAQGKRGPVRGEVRCAAARIGSRDEGPISSWAGWPPVPARPAGMEPRAGRGRGRERGGGEETETGARRGGGGRGRVSGQGDAMDGAESRMEATQREVTRTSVTRWIGKGFRSLGARASLRSHRTAVW